MRINRVLEISVVLPAVLAGGLLLGCANVTEEVAMTAKDFDLQGFTKVEVGGAFEVEIVRSDSFKVNVVADDFAHVRVEKVGDTLVIKRQGIEWLAPFHRQPRATVAMPALTGLNVSGASRGKFENLQSDSGLTVSVSGASHIEARSISAGTMDAKVTGASSLTGNITTSKNASLEVSGASKIELTGKGTEVIMKISGASRAELSGFPVQNADLEVSGASSAYINLNGRLDSERLRSLKPVLVWQPNHGRYSDFRSLQPSSSIETARTDDVIEMARSHPPRMKPSLCHRFDGQWQEEALLCQEPTSVDFRNLA